jgi:predicted outer membrane protein
MITDHTSVQKAVADLTAKLNVTPADSETSNSLKTQAQQTMQKLEGLKGKAFDKAYIDNEVARGRATVSKVTCSTLSGYSLLSTAAERRVTKARNLCIASRVWHR